MIFNRLSGGVIRAFRVLVIGSVCAIVSVEIAAEVRAETGERFLLPAGNARPRHGARLVVDSRWVDGNGYRPVRVELIQWPPGPSPADRSFRVVLRPRHWAGGTTTVTQFIELPQGATAATTTIAVPQNHVWGPMQVEVYEGGVRLDDLSEPLAMSTTGYQQSESTPTILIIDSDVPERDRRSTLIQQARFGSSPDLLPGRNLPDIRPLLMLLPELNSYGTTSAPAFLEGSIEDLDTLVLLQDGSKLEMLPPSELPDRWIDYTTFDLIFISRADLLQLVEQHPTCWRAIRDWLVCGATLGIYDTRLDDASLEELDRLLTLPSCTEGSHDGEPADLWQKPRLSNRDRVPHLSRNSWAGQGVELSPGEPDGEPRPEVAQQPGAQDDAMPFVIRDAGLGRVVAIASDEPFERAGNRLNWLFNEIRPENCAWYQRHGVSLNSENPDYWNWIVPGVGRAPVGSYLVLITLFVIVIGPVNYFWLLKRKRLYMLLVTVPLGAALVTFALLNYALLTDGLGMRVRVRSFTYLDQTNRHAASWSRQSYYAGLAPSGGLRFPESAAFYPIEQFPRDEYGRQNSHRRLLWDEGQHLMAGYLISRATSQLLVIQSGASQRELVVHADSNGESPSVENRLDADILRLILRDGDGRLFQVDDLATGAMARLLPADPVAATADLKRGYSDAQPAFPEGYDSNYYRHAFGRSRRWHWMGSHGQQEIPSFHQSILERSLRLRTYAGVQALPRRSYLAITRTGVEVPLGYQRLREQASFHVVLGNW